MIGRVETTPVSEERVTVKLFGLLKTLAKNQTEMSLPLRNGTKVADLVALLETDYPEMAELIQKKKVLISVNQDIAHPETAIRHGDEVALLPPFAGGAGLPLRERADEMLVRVQREDFSIDEELARIRARSRRIGGIAIFLGTARDRSQGRQVSGIKFEYYEGMAQKKLREIRERALKDFDVIDVLIIHRFGDIEVGDNIVLVIAAAEHRAEAFRACKWSIDELKQITPIWKLESTPEGEIWVEEHP
jgi:molybdopterin synthase catalytic subunit/molybdopterin converting factor small subunit